MASPAGSEDLHHHRSGEALGYSSKPVCSSRFAFVAPHRGQMGALGVALHCVFQKVLIQRRPNALKFGVINQSLMQPVVSNVGHTNCFPCTTQRSTYLPNAL